MQETVLISMPIKELQKLIIESIDLCFKHPEAVQKQKENLLTEQEAADFLNIPYLKLQSLINRCEVPIRAKGKRCYFSKSDLTLWKEFKEGGLNG
jgi:hypothetical protein